MIRRIRIHLLLRHGRELMTRYARAIETLMHATDAQSIRFAESICPSLKHYRRRARACARMVNRLRRTHKVHA